MNRRFALALAVLLAAALAATAQELNTGHAPPPPKPARERPIQFETRDAAAGHVTVARSKDMPKLDEELNASPGIAKTAPGVSVPFNVTGPGDQRIQDLSTLSILQH